MKRFNLVIAFFVFLGLVIGASFSQAADLNGTWTLSVTSPMGSGTPVFKLKQAGNTLTGDYKGTFGEAPVKGRVEGSSFTLRIPQSGQFIVYTGTFSGDTMKGTIDFAGQGNGDFKGTRPAVKAEKAAVKAEKAEVKAEKAAVKEEKAEKAAVKAEKAAVKTEKAEKAAVKAEKAAVKEEKAAVKEEKAAVKEEKKSTSRAADLNGTWTLSVTSPMGSGTPVFKLKQAGNTLTGDYKGTFGEAPVKGRVEGSSFTLRIPQSGQFIVYTGTFSGDTMKGTIDFAGQGNGDFKGTRTAK